MLKYIDIHDIDDQPDNKVLFDQIRKIDPDAKANEIKPVDQVDLPSSGIVMYCSKWCVDCRKARVWFEDQGLELTEVDVYETHGAVEQAREWGDGHLITPTFDIDGTIILDFDKGRLREALGL